jgi:hypothetical protein
MKISICPGCSPDPQGIYTRCADAKLECGAGARTPGPISGLSNFLSGIYNWVTIPLEGRKAVRKGIIVLGLVLSVVVPVQAQEREQERLQECGTVLQEILGIPDNIPQDLLDRAECAIVFPSV